MFSQLRPVYTERLPLHHPLTLKIMGANAFYIETDIYNHSDFRFLDQLIAMHNRNQGIFYIHQGLRPPR